MGGGAVVGGLLIAGRNRPNIHRLTAIGATFGVLILAVALAPNLVTALVVIFPMGALSIGFIATANATLQLRAEPSMRGRVMALYAVAFLGTTPIGSPLVGWISQEWSPRVALAVGAVATIAASLVTRHVHQRGHQRTAEEPVVLEESEPGTELGVA
jgi:MFS family permease